MHRTGVTLMWTQRFFCVLAAGSLLAALQTCVPDVALASEAERWGSVGFGSSVIVFRDTDPGGSTSAEIAVGTHRDQHYG